MVRALVKYWLLLSMCSVACSGPIAPSATPTRDTSQLTVLVYGHISQRPITNIGVELLPPAGVPMAIVESRRKILNATGRATWTVFTGQRYAVVVRGRLHFGQTPVGADSQWLLSLPE